jgi:hypothetical protein
MKTRLFMLLVAASAVLLALASGGLGSSPG